MMGAEKTEIRSWHTLCDPSVFDVGCMCKGGLWQLNRRNCTTAQLLPITQSRAAALHLRLRGGTRQVWPFSSSIKSTSARSDSSSFTDFLPPVIKSPGSGAWNHWSNFLLALVQLQVFCRHTAFHSQPFCPHLLLTKESGLAACSVLACNVLFPS